METGIPRASVRRIAEIDLGLTHLTLTYVQRLTREDEKKRNERGKKATALHDTCQFRKKNLY